MTEDEKREVEAGENRVSSAGTDSRASAPNERVRVGGPWSKAAILSEEESLACAHQPQTCQCRK